MTAPQRKKPFVNKPYKLANAIVLSLAAALLTLLASSPLFAQSNDDLLPIGSKAPNFTLNRKGGGTVQLSRVLQSNKVVVLNFWMIYCPPCRAELPELNKMRTRLHGKGFDVLSVNVMDSPEDAAKFWTYNRLKIPLALNGSQIAAEKYRVTAVPANYVIGHNGKILARYVGYDEAGIRKTLAKAGIK